MTTDSLKLTVEHLAAGYGAVRALHDVSLEVRSGEIVALLGTNGNGKSTLMKCIMGLVEPARGSIVLELDGARIDLAGKSPQQIVGLGVALVPEGRRLFPRLTVKENLLLGAFRRAARGAVARNLERCHEMFPVLRERSTQLAGSMSGGQQQMLAIVLTLNAGGVTVIMIEHIMRAIMRFSQRVLCFDAGRVIAEGTPAQVIDDPNVQRVYLGG